MPAKSYRVNVHFLAPETTGQAVGVRINHNAQTIEKYAMGPACMVGTKTWPVHQTLEADGVSCPKCRATPVWKAAMTALLTERCVPDDDPQWQAVGGPPAVPVEPPPAPAIASTPIVTPATPPEPIAAATAAAAGSPTTPVTAAAQATPAQPPPPISTPAAAK
jgi:hypothetical protein